MNRFRGSDIFPEYLYRKPREAIDFLERAFGFTPHLVVPGDGETIAHAELRVGEDFVMLGTLDDELAITYAIPNDIDERTTGSSYIARPDIEDLYDRARRAGAKIVRELMTTEYGSTDFSARDPEGFLWHFGTYRPTIADESPSDAPKLYPGQRYARGRAAIAYLCAGFGFVEEFVVPNASDPEAVDHAQLVLGNGMIMLGSGHGGELRMVTPTTIGGRLTQHLNVFVADPDAHHERALAAGVEIVRAPTETSYGARGYHARDCDGYRWNFSTYRPSAAD